MTFVANASVVITIYFVSSLKNLFTSPGMRLDFQISVKGSNGSGVRNFLSNLSILPQNIILMRVKRNPFYPKLELFYSDWSGVERGGGA